MGGRALGTSLWLWEAPGRAPRDTNPPPPDPLRRLRAGDGATWRGRGGPQVRCPGPAPPLARRCPPRPGVTPRSLAPFHRLSQEIVLPPLGFPRAAPVAVAGGAVCVNASPTCTERRLFPYEQTFVVKTGEGTS